MAAERASDRLVRLLGLVAYLDGVPEVRVEDLAERFGVTPEQLLRDIDTLWVSGTPGYWPDDLIDFDADSIEHGVVRLTQARGMTRPLRLGTREAVALIAALRALRSLLHEVEARERVQALDAVLATLTEAVGDAAASVDVRLTVEGSPEIRSTLGAALREGRTVVLRYVNGSDVVSEREVDPYELRTPDRHSYLIGWCRSAQAERTFRLDRILEARVGDHPVERRPGDAPQAPTDAVFVPAADAELVTLRLAGSARWLVEQLPTEAERIGADGSLEVDLRVQDPRWLQHFLLQNARHVLAVAPEDAATGAVGAAAAALRRYAARPGGA